MERISKPHIVDLLRYFDKKRVFSPRIRYASVRSKPELIKDLLVHFFVFCEAPSNLLLFRPRRHPQGLPLIQYDLKARRFLLDGKYYEVPESTRCRPKFAVSRGPVTLYFPTQADWLSREKVSGDVQASLAPDSGVPLGY